MNEKARGVILVVAFVVLVGGLVYWYRSRPEPPPPAPVAEAKPAPSTTVEPSRSGRPIFVDVGSSSGLADQMMTAVLVALREGFRGRLDVRFENVNTDPGAKERYSVTVIPTQIYYSPEGKELYRHQGFAQEQEIVKKWKELGYDLMNAPERAEDMLDEERPLPPISLPGQ